MPGAGTVPYLAIIFLLGAVVGGGIVSGLIPLRRRVIEEIDPRTRVFCILVLSILPLLLGGVLVADTLLPSVLDYLGWANDHCLAGGGAAAHHGHLCIVHGTPPSVGTADWFMIGIVGAFLIWRVGMELVDWFGARRRLETIRKFAKPSEDGRQRIVPSDIPFAFTSGLVWPTVYLSAGLVEQLDGRSRSVVESHESFHARWRHGTVNLAVRVASVFLTPGAREWLLSELALSFEQISDRHAARTVGDQLTVAETILEVERLAGQQVDEERGGRSVAGFGDGDIERRVRSLLDDQSWRSVKQTLCPVVIGLILVGATQYEAVHGMVEWVLCVL